MVKTTNNSFFVFVVITRRVTYLRTSKILIINMTDSESGSSSLSFYNESEESLSSLREDDSEILNGCYENEPVYTEAELTQIKSDSETSSSEEELDSSRLENLHWCSCECCVIFSPMLLEECKCCKENVNLLADKLAGIKCITHNEDFYA